MIIKNEIWKFIQNYCRPSTDLRKVKVINNELYQTHYRVATIDELYIQFAKQNPWDFSISQSAFYTFLPKWLLVRKKYEGICKICFITYFYAKQLRIFRMQLHKDCHCACIMCSQCSHGKGIFEFILWYCP